MTPGIDLIGIGSKAWNIKGTVRAINEFPGSIDLGAFVDDTFGPNAVSNVRKCLDTGKISQFRGHLNWVGPNPKHVPPPRSKIKKLAPIWESIARQYPHTEFFISPSCEWESSNKAVLTDLLQLTAGLCPSCTIVQSPINKTPVIEGYRLERHGKTVVGPGQVISYDGGKPVRGGDGKMYGQSLFDIDAAKWVRDNSRAEMCLSWGELCNMAEAHNTLPPNRRTVSPSPEYILSLLHLFDDPGICPTPIFASTPLKKPFLYKSHAEDSPGADPRNNRGLFIAKPKAGAVDLVTFDGKPVGKFTYRETVGPFPPDLSRFYSGNPGGVMLYGYQIAEKAKQISGSPWVWLRHHGKNYPIHPTFRSPFFQA